MEVDIETQLDVVLASFLNKIDDEKHTTDTDSKYDFFDVVKKIKKTNE